MRLLNQKYILYYVHYNVRVVFKSHCLQNKSNKAVLCFQIGNSVHVTICQVDFQKGHMKRVLLSSLINET